MLLQMLATGATGVKQARYRRRPTRAARHSYAHAQYLYTQPVYTVHYGRFLALAVQCETTHGVYEFRRGFCTLVLSFSLVVVDQYILLDALGPPHTAQDRERV